MLHGHQLGSVGVQNNSILVQHNPLWSLSVGVGYIELGTYCPLLPPLDSTHLEENALLACIDMLDWSIVIPFYLSMLPLNLFVEPHSHHILHEAKQNTVSDLSGSSAAAGSIWFNMVLYAAIRNRRNNDVFCRYALEGHTTALFISLLIHISWASSRATSLPA